MLRAMDLEQAYAAGKAAVERPCQSKTVMPLSYAKRAHYARYIEDVEYQSRKMERKRRKELSRQTASILLTPRVPT